ncbi:MAG: FecR family protein [Proteiniphilum sp.]|jgi:transmembrane sensor|nr:FecR family protein [Proteiniphilum sp.]MDD3955710.1 FecR family protein [Proteiniphilum sp.]
MERELLHRFFEGKTSYQEEKIIRSWIETSDANHAHFLRERRLYDALLLTDGKASLKRKKITISTFGIISTTAAVMLVLIIGGIYLYGLRDKSEQYNTILVPAGQRINLVLSDHTNLWLNANTTFRYPTEFSKKNRTVYLDGEAYFEVSKNEKKPFVVKTTQGDIHVTGTSFNLESYSKHQSFVTSLFEGGVDVYRNEEKVVSLNPNEKSTLKSNELIVSKITDTDPYLWRKGLIAFNKENLENILLSLEKYFDVDIQINPLNLPQHTYTGKFRQSDGVDYALKVLQKSIRFKYERDETTNIIHIK